MKLIFKGPGGQKINFLPEEASGVEPLTYGTATNCSTEKTSPRFKMNEVTKQPTRGPCSHKHPTY